MCRKRLFLVMLAGIAVAAWAWQGAAGADAVEISGRRTEPCYVVIAVDVSGSMERADAPTKDARGRRWTLRDEGQLTLLQLLPFVYSDLYVGVCHFSDRVRYALPSAETGPVLSWGGNYLSEAACRNMVRPAEFLSSFRTDISRSLDWALARIQAARRLHGDGPGKVLLLTHGDPRDSSKELGRGGPLARAGARLAEQNIHVYPIIINEASYRPNVAPERLSSSERAAEGVMVSLASMTGGRAYRIAAEMGFPDILLDIFGLGMPLAGEVRISPYDWAVVVVGATPDSVRVSPAGSAAASQAVTWRLNDPLEPQSEIRSQAVPSAQWPATVLRRPGDSAAVERLWKGGWELALQSDQPETAARIYRVPDFVLQLEAEPAFPWWIHQQGQLRAWLLDRHGGRRDVPGGGDGLSVRVTAQTIDERESFRTEAGQWLVPARLYSTESFAVQTPGSYGLTCEVLYSLDGVDVPLIGLTRDLQVHPACVGIDILSAAEETLGTLPETSETLSVDTEGGRQVYFRAAPRGTFDAEPLSGAVHLAPLSQTRWAFGEGADGTLDTTLIGLPEGEEQLTGRAEVEVRTSLGIRQFRLPDFELTYRPAPVRFECTFGDTDRPLWVGELHRQLLTVSAFPVFERLLDQTRELFPETLSGARMRTVDLQSGVAQVTGPGGRLVETPRPTGEKGRTLSATYSLESEVPIPQANQCEISAEGTIENLRNAVKTYEVVDPVADGLFRWDVYQEPRPARSSAVSEVLYSGEPVRFSAQWRADQNVSAVHFEIQRSESEEPLFVDLPVAAGANQAAIERVMPPLESGQTYPVYVHVTRRSATDVPPVQIKLRAGQFRPEDRRLVLAEMLVGTEAARDIACHAWEPVEVPLRVIFRGYLAGDPEHGAMIEQFKQRCRLTVRSSRGQVRDITEAIEWTALVPEAAPAGQATRCQLEGHAPYIPENTGRATVELKAAFSQEQTTQTDSGRQAFGYLAIRAPRLTIGIQRLTPSGEVLLFDSLVWAERAGALFPATVGYSTRLRVRIRAADATDAAPTGSWNIALRVLRRAAGSAGPWIVESSQEHDLSGSDVLVREVQVSKDGQYALEVVGRSAASGVVLTHLTTPAVVTVQQNEVASLFAPPAWITPRVRRWPFEYRVTLHREPGELSEAAPVLQFQLSGDDPAWLEASAHVTESDTSQSLEVLVESPEVLPSLGTVRDGAARFRLSVQGLELLTWEVPNVRVLAPVLERLALTRLSHGPEVDATNDMIAWDGSTGLWARPVFRATPELAGQWTREKTVLYLWPDGGDVSSGDRIPLSILQQPEGESRATATDAGYQAFVIAGDDPDQVVEVLPRRVRWRFWGWPKPAVRARYALAASAIYRGQDTVDPSQMVAEWTPVYTVDLVLPRVIPWCWYFLGAIAVYMAVVAIVRLFARHPDRLGYDMRLAENVATVEPAALGSPVEIQLQQTTLDIDISLHARYLANRWEGVIPVSGKLAWHLAHVVAAVKVLVRRWLLPRRWAWTLIAPKTGGQARHVRQGLLCLWTSPFARKAQAWCSEGGSFDLPAAGQTRSITLDLPYQMDGMSRTMRVSIKVRKVGPLGANRGSGASPEAEAESESEFLI
ncbi:MAG: VWA domain-containing protein [Phycisphaerales bacterium]|nr:MAG: VWA domain-containing protein [Phycisphaerales bacterium]